MESDGKIQAEANFLEQNLQAILFQKQAFELEKDEISASLKEIDNSGDDVYKIVGQLMVRADREKMKKELSEKNKMIDLRIKNLANQEGLLREKLSKIRK